MKFKNLILIILASHSASLTSCSKAHAGWFGWSSKEVDQIKEEHEVKLAEAGRQITQQRKSVENWELVSGSLAVGGVALLIIGTALGTRTRHAAARTLHP